MGVWGLAELLAVGGVVYWCWLVGMTAWTLAHPPRRTYAWAVSRGHAGDPGELDPPMAFESWEVAVRGMRLPVWDVRGMRPRGPVVVMTSGWGDSRVGGLLRLPVLARHASRVILWEMPGHGEAPGVCSLGTREVGALRAVLDAIGAGAPVVLYGWSLGGGVSIAAGAGDGRVVGVIAEAPYREPWTPAQRVLANVSLPWRLNLRPALWLLGTVFGVGPGFGGFDRAEHAGRLECPLLVVHGTADAVCPIEDGRAIAGACPGGRLVAVEGGGHNNLWTEPAFRACVERAIEEYFVQVAGASALAAQEAGRA